MRGLVTRPEPGASETAIALKAIGIEPIIAPVLTPRWLTPEVPPADSIDAVALTSAYAVRGLMALAGAEALKGKPAYAVGDATAAAARAAGFSNVQSASGGLPELIELVSGNLVHGTLLYPHAHHVAGNLGALLSGEGIGVTEMVVYTMQEITKLPEAARRALVAGEIELVLLYSGRTAETFCALASGLSDAARARLTLLCLSEPIAGAVRDRGFGAIHVADAPNEAAILALASSFAGGENPA